MDFNEIRNETNTDSVFRCKSALVIIFGSLVGIKVIMNNLLSTIFNCLLSKFVFQRFSDNRKEH